MKRTIAICLSVCILLSLCAQAAFARENWFWPVRNFYNISSGYGQRSFGWHDGIDIDSTGAGQIRGQNVLASRSGTVIAIHTACTHNYPKRTSAEYCSCGGGFGNYVYIRHSDGMLSIYGHLSEVLVQKGTTVTQGTVIGTVGSTGRASGYHLHFEINDSRGNSINPMPTDDRHTTIGSSAPDTKSISYIYDLTGKRVVQVKIGETSMYVDGVKTEIDPGRATSAFLYSGRTMLPVRALAEVFGASVVWDETEQKVTVYSEDTTIQLWIDKYTAKVNSVTQTMDVAPMLVNGRTFMPVRFIAESLGLTVGWNDANQTVMITGEI